MMESFERQVDETQADETAGDQQSETETEPVADPTQPSSSSGDETPSGEETPSESTPTQSSESSEPTEGEGILTGTGSELEPGVGGTGDHPAPAVVRDPADGRLHVAGEPPAGTVAEGEAPAGDTTDLQSGEDVTDPEARERLNEVSEPDQIETDRPDIGTE